MGNLTREVPKGRAICRSCKVDLQGIQSTLLSDTIGGKRVRVFICDVCITGAWCEIMKCHRVEEERTMTVQEAVDMTKNIFTIEDAFHAPCMFKESGEVNEDFIEYCKEKGYLDE